MHFSEKPFIPMNSCKTINLCKNDVSLSNNKKINTSFQIHQQFNECREYKEPRGLSENYLYFLNKTVEDLVNNVIAKSEKIFQCSLKTYKLNVSKMNHKHKHNKATNKKHIQICRDRLIPISDLNNSLTSELRWLDDQEALVKISEYIKQNWDLDEKFLFTIEKTDTSITCGSTCHKYKVEFSMPTPEYPIPQITVSVFFIVETTPYLSLPTYVKYQFEMDRRTYVIGKHLFNKKRFEHLFEIKRDVYADINRYPGWSSGHSASDGCSHVFNS